MCILLFNHWTFINITLFFLVSAKRLSNSNSCRPRLNPDGLAYVSLLQEIKSAAIHLHSNVIYMLMYQPAVNLCLSDVLGIYFCFFLDRFWGNLVERLTDPNIDCKWGLRYFIVQLLLIFSIVI